MTANSKYTIAFFGAGNMGLPMIKNLIKAGHTLRVFDPSATALEAARQAGAQVGMSVEEGLDSVDWVLSMLPAAQHVKGLYIQGGNAKPLLEIAKPRIGFIDCSTIDPQSAQEVCEHAKNKGLRMLSAPVSGGVGGATAGTLTFMVGGPPEDLEQARGLLSLMGKNIFHAGPTFGDGQAAKLCNNMLLAIHMVGTSEALNLGVKLGLKAEALSEIMKNSSGGNWSLNVYNPYPGVMDNVPASRDYQGGFAVALMLKDLGLALDAAKNSQSKTPLGAMAQKLFEEHSSQGDNKSLDFSSILKFIEKA